VTSEKNLTQTLVLATLL